MKISTFIFMLLSVGAVLILFSQMVTESNNNYGTAINVTSLDGRYDFAGEVNESITPIKTSIDKITNQENGWLDRVGGGFTGIIAAVTFLPSLIWKAGLSGGRLITGLSAEVNLTGGLILIFIIGLTFWGIGKLIEFYQRWPF